MTFLNALLTLGAAAFTVPLIIHLLNRSRYMTLDWGAMQFLAQSIKVNSKRIQWKQWLLLLIRCMIPVLLALAMARPMIVAWRDSGQANALSVAILLDDSLSMQSLRMLDTEDSRPEELQRKSLFHVACREITSLLSQLPQGSSACLILAGKPIEVLAQHDPDELVSHLESLAGRLQYSGTLDLESGVQAATEWLNRSPHLRRHLLLVSDFQRLDWDEPSRATVRTARNLLANQPVPIPWTFLDVSASGVIMEPPPDVAVLSMDCMPGIVVENGQITISATLQNRDKSPVQVPVSLQVGLEEVERQSLQIGPQSSLTARFQWTPSKTEDAEVRVVADWNDATPADNEIARVLPVRKPTKVLLIDGDRRNEAMRSDSDFLRLALTPFSLLHGQPGDLFVTRVVDGGGWNEAMLSEFEIVACCNMPDLTPQQRSELRAFVESGGGLLIALGDKVQIDRYNVWEGTANGGLRPGSLLPRDPRDQQTWVGAVRPTETPFFELSKPTMDSLASVRFTARNAIELEDPTAWSGWIFDDGVPWIVDVPMGKGRCVWMMSAIDDGDSNLPARPAFVPLMQKLMGFIGRVDSGWRQLEPGEVWRETWDPAKDLSSWVMQVTANNATTVSVPLPQPTAERSRGGVISEWTAPRAVGVVRASLGDEVHRVGVDVSPAERKREMERIRLAPEELQTLLVDASAEVVNDVKQWLSLIRSDWSGRELWTWFWLALLVMFLSEIALQQSLTPRLKQRTSFDTSLRSTSDANRGAA